MKIVYTILFLALAIMAHAQSSAPSQSNTQSPTAQPSRAQSATPPASPQTAQQPAQRARPFYRWELAGGWSHITGNEGLNGFNVGGSVFLDPKISLGFNYDGVYDTTVLGSFALTNVGLTVTKSHLQDFMTGPRFYFPGLFALHCGAQGHLPILHPFVQAQFGESELWTEVSLQNVGTVTSSDTAFSWLLGGGGDFDISEHFAARISTDLLRTHFVDTGQSRLRLIVGVVGRF